MLKFALSSILWLVLLSSSAQTSVQPTLVPKLFLPKETIINCRLGDRIVKLKTFQYGDRKDIVYINLHDDEVTAVNGAKKLLERDGGLLIKIENFRTRNIKFKFEGKNYTFDPNRMFSRPGIIQSLTLFGRVSNKAADEIESFASRILELIPDDPTYIIALHNNSNGAYSINSYLPGNLRERDAKQLFKNSDQDPDDIFLTTDSLLFRRLSEDKKFNAIWQDNAKAKKDGSLSIYCGEKNIRYVNCETEHGKQDQYDEMILSAFDLIQKETETTVSYDYRLMQAGGHYSPKVNTEIVFGNKKVGYVSSIRTDSSWSIVGKLEFSKDFPLYSNMDFYLFLSANNVSRLEARIDPTRVKQLLDPAKATIPIIVKGVK